MFKQNIILAIKDMSQSKMRTFLSLLGIVIGVASVITIISLGSSVSDQMIKSMNSGGLDQIPVSIFGYTESTSKLDPSFGQVILDNVDELDSYQSEIKVNNKVKSQFKEGYESISGVSAGYLEPVKGELVAGKFFSTMDNVIGNNVVVLGEKIASRYFPEGSALNQSIKIIGNKVIDAKIIGIVKNDVTLNKDLENSILVPYTLISQRLLDSTSGLGFDLFLHIKKGYDAKKVSDKTSNFLNSYIGSDSFFMFSPAYLQDMAKSVTDAFSLFLAGVAAISLVVGGIGIMNIMLVSVVERTKEIGIRKALGANPSTIRKQFITEASVITLTGGIIGVILGFFISKVVCDTVGWVFIPNYFYALIAVLFSSLVGIFFGWYPAKKASKLDPIVALNYE